jgi:hypothetical protein
MEIVVHREANLRENLRRLAIQFFVDDYRA